MLTRTDQFRELDRLNPHVSGTHRRPTLMPMDAWRHGEELVVEFDLPGVDTRSIDLDMERHVLTVRAERLPMAGHDEAIAVERPRGVYSRQLFLGDAAYLDRVEASYTDGVLRLRIPVAGKAEPRTIRITAGDQAARAIPAQAGR